MMSPKKQEQKVAPAPPRPRRGRPAGKNRVPLSREERRARNAQYERERRANSAAAAVELAESVGVDPNKMSQEDVLAAAVSFIRQRTGEGSTSNEVLARANEKLEAELREFSQLLDNAREEERLSMVVEESIPPEPLEDMLLTPEKSRQVWAVLEPYLAGGDQTLEI